MRPKAPKETAEQRQQRIAAERENVRAIKSTMQEQTSAYRRMMGPRVSIATGRRLSGVPLGR